MKRSFGYLLVFGSQAVALPLSKTVSFLQATRIKPTSDKHLW
jgi:hypothetical protein